MEVRFNEEENKLTNQIMSYVNKVECKCEKQLNDKLNQLEAKLKQIATKFESL